MTRWECKIEKVSNGFICTTYVPNSVDEEAYLIEKNLFTEEEDNNGQAFIELVWHMAEYFAEIGSKHDAQRFWVGFRDQSGACKE